MLSGQGAFKPGQPLLPLQEAAAAGSDNHSLAKFPQGLSGRGKNGLGQLWVAEMEEAALATAMRRQFKGGLIRHALDKLAWFVFDLAGAKA